MQDKGLPPERPLAGARVLITRSPERSLALVDALQEAGASALLLPLIDFERAPDQHSLDVACDALGAGAFDWLVVSSATTVHVLTAKAAERGLSPAQWIPPATRIAAVGAATRRLLEDRGLEVALTPEDEQSAAGLLAVWPGGDGKVLLPQADIASPRLAGGLSAAGSNVTAVTAYRTVDYPAAAERRLAIPAVSGGADRQPPSYALLTPEIAAAELAAGRLDAVIAASPSAARRIHELSPLRGCRLVAIGRSTADQADALGLPVAAIAAEPSPDGLVAAVVAALRRTEDAGGETTLTRGTPASGHPHTTHTNAKDRTMTFPSHRPRRLRTTPAMRRLTAETRLAPAELILPAFIREGLAEPNPITSMPGVVQHTTETLKRAAAEAVELGLGGIMLFGIPETRDAEGTASLDPDGVLNKAIRDVRAEVGDDLVVMSDVCLDEFTDHGHCGVLDADGYVDNDRTVEIYARMAVAQADAGAHMLGPSGMMDGQIAAIRAALDGAGHTNTSLIAYAAKYASAFYGPFREAVDSQLEGDRRTYQMDAGNRTEALREVELDLAEGADIVMVKPAMSYLDIVADVAAMSPVPVAAYQISGEYAMIEAAAANGWIDRQAAITESVLGIRRAGAHMVLTYWAAELAGWLKES